MPWVGMLHRRREGGMDGWRKKKTIGMKEGRIMTGREKENGREEMREDRNNEAGPSPSLIKILCCKNNMVA